MQAGQDASEKSLYTPRRSTTFRKIPAEWRSTARKINGLAKSRQRPLSKLGQRQADRPCEGGACQAQRSDQRGRSRNRPWWRASQADRPARRARADASQRPKTEPSRPTSATPSTTLHAERITLRHPSPREFREVFRSDSWLPHPKQRSLSDARPIPTPKATKNGQSQKPKSLPRTALITPPPRVAQELASPNSTRSSQAATERCLETRRSVAERGRAAGRTEVPLSQSG